MAWKGDPPRRSGRVLRLSRAARPSWMARQTRHRRRRSGQAGRGFDRIIRSAQVRSPLGDAVLEVAPCPMRFGQKGISTGLPRGIRCHHGHPPRRDAVRSAAEHRRGVHGRDAQRCQSRASRQDRAEDSAARRGAWRHVLGGRRVVQDGRQDRIRHGQAARLDRRLSRNGAGLPLAVADPHAERHRVRRRGQAQSSGNTHSGRYRSSRGGSDGAPIRKKRQDDAHPRADGTMPPSKRTTR